MTGSTGGGRFAPIGSISQRVRPILTDMASYAAPRLTELLLGPPGRQRLRASQSLLGVVCYFCSAAIQQVEVAFGFIDPTESAIVAAFYLGGGVLFYALIRSGVNQRLTTDPGLTVLQTAFGLVALTAAYAITGPARGALMCLMVNTMVFSMFSLRAGQSRLLALFGLMTLSLVMAWKIHTEPLRYPWEVEAIHLSRAAFVLTMVGVLAGRIGEMRNRLKSQKHELNEALKRLSQLATHDELTGLANRRHMLTLLGECHARQSRDGTSLSIAMLDIDHFKVINDRHGHAAGDAVLKAFAESAQRVLRTTDVLARWGGEEFLLLLPGATTQRAQRTTARLRAALGETSLDNVASGIKVTFSAGLAECGSDESINACIERADRAMYTAKAKGRDRSVTA